MRESRFMRPRERFPVSSPHSGAVVYDVLGKTVTRRVSGSSFRDLMLPNGLYSIRRFNSGFSKEILGRTTKL